MSEEMEKKETGNEVVALMPAVDILESVDNVTLWFEVPGANAETVNIEVKDGILSLKAASSLRRNGKPLEFRREFRLADGVDVEKIGAATKDGVLTLVIPKNEHAKVHKIKVQ